MELPNVALNKAESEDDSTSPEAMLREFRARNQALDARLDNLLESIQKIREDIRHDAEDELTRLSKAAIDMANGRVYQHIDIQAKGELGILVRTFNQTLLNLQQLDASVKDQTNKVPELAAQLDAITADTEVATQNVMNRVDMLMAKAEEAGRFFAELQRNSEEYKHEYEHLVDGISEFLERAKKGESSTKLAQEILDYWFESQVTPKPKPMDLSTGQALLQTVSDEAFEIMNILQFQDITRQKIEKVVQLLKRFRQSLDRLLEIFNIKEEGEEDTHEIFENRKASTQDNIFSTGIIADGDTGGVDDIVAQYNQLKATSN
jgi:chemotaxis regulatin CheY-phosphate phosphatase CheZ